MISKKLLIEVLKCKDNVEFYQDDNYIVIGYDGENYYDINIYELQHKCKEWAFDSKGWMIYERKTVVGTYDYTALSKDGKVTPNYNDVFALCQWILENR